MRCKIVLKPVYKSLPLEINHIDSYISFDKTLFSRIKLEITSFSEFELGE
jgi:hypothetical protein